MITEALDRDAILQRTHAGREAMRAAIPSTAYPLAKLLFCILGVSVACWGEYHSMTEALTAQFPAQSDGTDLGKALMSMRLVIVGTLLLCEVVWHYSAQAETGFISGLLRRLLLLPMLIVMLAMAAFMYATGTLATGGDGSGGVAGISLGALWGGVFSVSLFGSHVLAKVALPAARTVVSGSSARWKLAALDRQLRAEEQGHAEKMTLTRTIEVKETTDVLKRRAAASAAAVVGGVQAEVHSRVEPLKARAADARDTDLGVPVTPLPALERVQTDLKAMDFDFFMKLLNGKPIKEA